MNTLELITKRMEDVELHYTSQRIPFGQLEMASRMFLKKLSMELCTEMTPPCLGGWFMEDMMGLAYNHHIISNS